MKWTVLATAFLLSGVLCPAADLYRVAGTVINTQTGSAIPHAHVHVLRARTSKILSQLITGEDGRFRFDLPEGSYALQGGIRNSLETYGLRNPDISLGSAVIVGPGHDTANLVFRWFPPGAISGRVVDDSGEPVEGALVQLLRSSVTAGRRITATYRWFRTDDRGEYRFGGIPGGARYYLAVTAQPWYATDNPFRQPAEHSPAFIPVCYPGTNDPAHAAPLLLKPGEEARADFTLTSAIGATVFVKHDGPAGAQGMIGLLYEGIAGSDGFEQQQNLDPGPGPGLGQPLAGIPPGHYVVRAQARSGNVNLAGRAVVDVNGSDVAVEVALHPLASVTGTLRFANPAVKPTGSVLVSLAREDGPGSGRTTVKADGSFAFPAVTAGKYRPGLASTDGFFTAGIEVNGVPYRNGLIEVSDGDSATLSITAGDDIGNVNGFVMNGDQPVEAVLAVLVPADGGRPALYRGYQTESDGSFNFRHIPAGRYFLFSVDDTAFEYANPDALQPYLPLAKSVTVAAHQSATERISVTPPQGK